ncbi:hypothetical protein O3W52_04520 [Ensifer psoraleae]|uniref:Uncharacterized protein n=1 Tax=Sinorhizobium psoraleae TaxID=520838 RepID=A0ABT4KBW5_9HYPH|nr:hypothetical protein [Sinorhizobium psoraleae]
MANAECRLIREDRIRKQETLLALQENANNAVPRSHGFRDLRVVHQERARELSAKGFVKVADGVDHLEFAQLARSRELPPGTIHLWAIDEVWSPIAVRVNRKAINERLSGKEATITPERADELARMLALPDAEDISAEQMAYRRKVQADVESTDQQDHSHAA